MQPLAHVWSRGWVRDLLLAHGGQALEECNRVAKGRADTRQLVAHLGVDPSQFNRDAFDADRVAA
jgi:hypothetical protein